MKHSPLSVNFKGYDTDIAASTATIWKRWGLSGAGVALAAALLWIVTDNWGWACILVIIAGFALYIPAVRRRFRLLWSLSVAMQNFASRNNMRYVETAKPNYKAHFLPAVSKLGLFERKEQIVKGLLDGYEFETYVHTFRQIFARRYSRDAVRVYCLVLPQELPHIFIRNRRAGESVGDTVLRHFDDDQRIGLEGNFDTFFTTYTHRRTFNETLSLLAPNVMETLIASNKKFDIEIVGNRLYFYTADYFTTAADFKEALHAMEAFRKHIDHRLRSWKFTLPNNKHYPYLQSHAGAATIAIGHEHYSKAWLAIAAYIIGSTVQIWLNPVYWKIKAGTVVFFTIVMVLALIVFRVQYQLSTRNVRR